MSLIRPVFTAVSLSVLVGWIVNILACYDSESEAAWYIFFMFGPAHKGHVDVFKFR